MVDGDRTRAVEVAIDLRRLRGDVDGALAQALEDAAARTEARGFPLESFGPLSASVIWRLNRLYWERLPDWEAALGRRYDESLPGGGSDAAHPDAVGAAVERCWSLLRDLELRGALPATLYVLELAVGTGARAELWLDRFRALDAERGTGYCQRLRCLLGDIARPTLERVRERLRRHEGMVDARVVDALDPLRALVDLRGQVLYVHLTSIYDNFVCDELALREGEPYLVEARAYVPRAHAEQLAARHGARPEDVPRLAGELLAGGGPGLDFWRELWDALRLEERYAKISLEGMPRADEVDTEHLRALVADAPRDVRFHLSSGAAGSFARTLPLLHPRGFLEVQDLFVASLSDYLEGFRGPGKLDGSVVNWVNGPLLRVIADRAGYEVRFAPFRYRAGSKLSILTASRRA